MLEVPPSAGGGVLPLHDSAPVMWLPSMTVGPPTFPVTENRRLRGRVLSSGVRETDAIRAPFDSFTLLR